jgi:hypothetical protein
MDPRGGIEDDPPSSLFGSRMITIVRKIKVEKKRIQRR